MSKEKDNVEKVEKIEKIENAEFVRCNILSAISFGGVRIAPTVDRKGHVTPLENAVIPAERAIAHGVNDVEVIGSATEDDFKKFIDKMKT